MIEKLFTSFFLKRRVAQPSFNPQALFGAVKHLTQLYNLPVSEEMLHRFGNSEGLDDDQIKSILLTENQVFDLKSKGFRERCLKAIVMILISSLGMFDNKRYKTLVNLVNGLSLSFSFLDKTICQVTKQLGLEFQSEFCF